MSEPNLSEITLDDQIQAVEYAAAVMEPQRNSWERGQYPLLIAAARTLRAMQGQTEHEPLTTAEIRMAGQRAGMMMAAAFLDNLSRPEYPAVKAAAKLIRQEANKYLCTCGAGGSFHDLPCPLAVPGPVTDLSQGEYDALVRDAMLWRPRKEPTAWIDAEMVAWLAKRRAKGLTAVVSAYATERDDIATGDRVPLYAMHGKEQSSAACPRCHGSGSIVEHDQSLGPDAPEETITCPLCNGNGDPPPPEDALLSDLANASARVDRWVENREGSLQRDAEDEDRFIRDTIAAARDRIAAEGK